MNPTFLDAMSWEMAEVYGAITDQILINLAKHFSFFEADTVPRSTFQYQATKLAEMGQVSKETVQIIRSNLADADLALQGVLEQGIIDAVRVAEPELLEGVKRGVLRPATMPAVVAPNQMRAFNLYYQQAADKLNLVNTVMLESTKSAYQQALSGVVSEMQVAERIANTQTALDIAAGETITGVSSWNQALRHATDRLKTDGIVGFVDHAGRNWSAEAYVAMDVRTTVFNTGRSAVWEMNQDFGNDLYLVSYHSGARPLCYDWQNKVISSTDNARTVVDLDGNEIPVYRQSDTTYGEPAGLFGINCKHYPTPFIPGVSFIDGKPQNEEDNARTYAESQEQRRLERKLREEKRDLLMAKAQGASEDELKALRDKTRKSSEDIDEFCKRTGRARHRDREAVYTKREFPDKGKYDVSKFERDQKDLIDKFYRSGGEQTGYTFGQMQPNTPLVPNVAQQTAQPVQPVQPIKTTVDGHIEKLKGVLSEEEYKDAVELINNGETKKLYERYGDKVSKITFKKNGGMYYSWDEVEFGLESKPGMHKFTTMAHEMAHMFDAKIGADSTLTFNEVGLINTKCTIGSGAVQVLKVTPSTSDQFLTAMRKDKITLEGLLGNKESLLQMKMGNLRNASAGVQDAMDGFFGTQDKGLLPWGHGNAYYNKWYNRKIKDFGLQNDLKDALNELGMNVKNVTAAKQVFREYRTASELWANVVSALTCGGEELEAFKTYMPNTVNAALKIIGGL